MAKREIILCRNLFILVIFQSAPFQNVVSLLSTTSKAVIGIITIGIIEVQKARAKLVLYLIFTVSLLAVVSWLYFAEVFSE